MGADHTPENQEEMFGIEGKPVKIEAKNSVVSSNMMEIGKIRRIAE